MHTGPAAATNTSPPPCRALLIEDDAPLRERFARLLRAWTGGELVAACATLSEAVRYLYDGRIDLLLTDLKLPDGHGTQAIRLLRALNPAADVMVISVLADDETVVQAIEAGAAGYLLKDADPFELIEAVEELRAGRSPISSSIARVIVRRLNEPPAAPPLLPLGRALTAREIDILWGIAKGLTYAELGEQLGISKQTVPVHVKSIYRKLEANNRAEAVYEASRRGLLKL